jgi:hypothetical protein
VRPAPSDSPASESDSPASESDDGGEGASVFVNEGLGGMTAPDWDAAWTLRQRFDGQDR